MSNNIAARIWSQQQVGYVEQTSVDGDAMSRVSFGVTSSAGASNGTTLIDVNNISGASKTYNGRYWVRILSGTNQGQRKRIVSDDGAGTLTLEGNGFPNQVAISVNYEIWKSPEPVIVVGTSSGATNIVDAHRTDTDSASNSPWVGYYACAISGTQRGLFAKITGCVPGTGTFTVGSGFSGALTAGDVLVLRKFIEARSLKCALTETYEAKPPNRINFSLGDGITGVRGGQVDFSTYITPSGTLAATGTVANPSVLSGLFKACGLPETIDLSGTVDTGSTTTAIKITAGEITNFHVGQAIQYNGNVTFITAMTAGGGSADTLTVSPALPAAPIAATTVYACRGYTKSTSGDYYGATIEAEIDGIRHIMTGCKGNVSGADAAVPNLNFVLMVDDWSREYEPTPFIVGSAYTTTAPVMSSAKAAYASGTGIDIGGFTFTAGVKTVPKNVQGSKGINGRVGYHLSDYACGGTFKEIIASDDKLTADQRWLVRTARDIAVVMGSGGSCCAIRMPVCKQIGEPTPTDAGGLVEAPNVLQAQDAGTASNGTTQVKVPDFGIFLF